MMPEPSGGSSLGQLDMLGHVSLHVEGKMVGACKRALAHLALEGLGTGVLPVVAGQLVRPERNHIWVIFSCLSICPQNRPMLLVPKISASLRYILAEFEIRKEMLYDNAFTCYWLC